MDDALGILEGLVALLGVLFVTVWVISGAAERYFRRRESSVELLTPSGGIWNDLKDAVVALGSAIGAVVSGVAACLGGLIGCLFFLLIFGFVGLFFVFWLVKRLW
jgi:hypothetical protein